MKQLIFIGLLVVSALSAEECRVGEFTVIGSSSKWEEDYGTTCSVAQSPTFELYHLENCAQVTDCEDGTFTIAGTLGRDELCTYELVEMTCRQNY